MIVSFADSLDIYIFPTDSEEKEETTHNLHFYIYQMLRFAIVGIFITRSKQAKSV